MEQHMDSTRTREEALANPAQTNAEINAVVAGASAPEIEPPPDDTVRLPGGLARNGKIVKTAVVRELNGSDEEALSRALKSGSAFRFMDVLIERGTVSVGDVDADRELLKSMLIGDRDELALAIRVATYGYDIDIERWVCPACRKQTDIAFTLTDDVIERKTLGPDDSGVFEVSLRKGAKALVRLPNGADQEAMFADDSWTPAQRNTVLISRCVRTYTDPDGHDFNMAAFPSMSLKLSIPDRQKIIREITERQPGPRYNEVKFKHDECQSEVILALGVMDLFRDLILFL
jgi:hypothetical protein